MSRSLLRVNYEYSSEFKSGAVRDWHPLGAQVAFGSFASLLLCPRHVRLAGNLGNAVLDPAQARGERAGASELLLLHRPGLRFLAGFLVAGGVRFAAHNRLKSDISRCLKGANKRH